MSQSDDHSQFLSAIEHIQRHVHALLDAQPGQTDELRRWHEGSYRKTLSMAVDGKLSPATLVMRLRHTPDDIDRLERLAAVCAAMHTAADLADDCEDDDLNPEIWAVTDKPHAINVASGLLFTVYQAIDSLPITMEQRARIARIVTSAGLAMHVGQAQDLAATDRVLPADYAQICTLKTGAEIGAFFAIAAVILDRAHEPYEQFGRSLGALIQAVSDIVDVWLLPASPDLVAGKHGLPMALGLAVDPDGIRLAAAGDRNRPERQRQLRRLLCQPGVIHLWQQLLAGWIRDTREALAACGDEPDLQTLADEIIAQAQELTVALEDAAPQLRRAARRGTAPLVLPIVDQALDFLTDPQTPDDTADIQRWGLFGKARVIGDVFGLAVVAETLAEAGKSTAPILRHLLDRRDPDGWRYFPGERDIPCDADDLGAILSALHRGGTTGEALWAQVRDAVTAAYDYCAPIGHLTVWLYTPGTSMPPGSWGGDDCAGSIASGIVGLTLLDRPEWQPILEASVARLLDQQAADGLWYGYYYPEPHLCTSLVVRALVAQRDRVAPALADRITGACERVAQRLQATQQLNGGWGSPQATATALLAWMAIETVPAGYRFAVTYLEESIKQDGGWDAEPSFVTLGPNLVLADYCSRKVTSALCAKALLRAQRIASGKALNVETWAPSRFSGTKVPTLR
jgi:geranylgeranyl pyrophosphate synthase